MTLGDRVAVLRAGRLEQVAPPLELYRRPSTRFVADFIGTPRIDWLEGSLEREAGAVALVGSGFRLALPDALADSLAGPRSGRVALGIRPHEIEPCAQEEADLLGRVDLVEALGSVLVVHVSAEGGLEIRVQVSADEHVAVGDAIALRLRRDRLHLFDAESGVRLEERETP